MTGITNVMIKWNASMALIQCLVNKAGLDVVSQLLKQRRQENHVVHQRARTYDDEWIPNTYDHCCREKRLLTNGG